MMRKMMTLVVAAVLAFSLFAFKRMEASDGVKYRVRIMELQSTVAELGNELECRKATESLGEEESCCSSS